MPPRELSSRCCSRRQLGRRARRRRRSRNSTETNRSPCWLAAAPAEAMTPMPAFLPAICRTTFPAIPTSSPRTCRPRPGLPPPARSTARPTRTARPSPPSPMARPWTRCSATRARATTRRKFSWLGSIGKLQNVCATWHHSEVKTIAAARAREVIVAAAGATSNTAIVPKTLNALVGTKFKVIAGYDTGAGLTLALERGEAEGICGLSWSTIKASRPHWISDKLLNVIVQMGLTKLPDLPEVPSALDLVGDVESKQVLKLILIRQEAGRPFAEPPGVPADRLAALRRAFDATLADGEFRADADKAQLEVEPLTAAEIDALLAKAYGAPRTIVQKAAALVEPSGRAP